MSLEESLDRIVEDAFLEESVPPSFFLSAGLSVPEFEARALSYSLREGVNVLVGNRIRREHVGGILKEMVDLSDGMMGFVSDLMSIYF